MADLASDFRLLAVFLEVREGETSLPIGPRLLICILCNREGFAANASLHAKFRRRCKIHIHVIDFVLDPRDSPARFGGIIELAQLPSRPFVRTGPEETRSGWSEFPSDRRLSRRWFYKLPPYRAALRSIRFSGRNWTGVAPVGNFEITRVSRPFYSRSPRINDRRGISVAFN